MPVVFREYIEDGYQVTEYTRDGETVSHKVTVPVQSEPIESIVPEPTIEEQILAETNYQTALLEMNIMGGV